MSYIGNVPTTAAFPFDQFSGTGAATSFTLTYAPAGSTSILVAISGVMQNPNLYSVIGTTLSFSPAPPSGTNNISVLYLGLPVIGSSSPGNTAFLSATDLTATAGQTVFASAGSYTPGFVQVYRNGARLGNADFTATNGTTITLASAATAGDLVTIEYYTLTSLTNALPLTGGTVTGSTTFNSTVTVNGAAVSGYTGMKNRIINGCMMIDQRNAGASVTPIDGQYTLDRWIWQQVTAGKCTIAQSSTSATGFTKSLLITSTSAYTPLTGDVMTIGQRIEGFNVADLGWGTASAQTITVSFWVRSSLTGSFGGTLRNGASNRSYPFLFTISSANTFEYKTVTVAGDTSGTWATESSAGLQLSFAAGCGATYLGTAGAWATAPYYSATGATNLVGTSGATLYITGVQLERGSNATSFEFIDYGRQLLQCYRYYYRTADDGSTTNLLSTATEGANSATGNGGSFPVRLRVVPTATLGSGVDFYSVGSGGLTPTIATNRCSSTTMALSLNITGGVNGQAGAVYRARVNGYIEFSAEL